MRRVLMFLLGLFPFIAIGESGPSRELWWQTQAGENLSEIEKFRVASFEKYSFAGKEVFDSLVLRGMPAQDMRTLSAEFLLDNLHYAMKARKEFPWSDDVSWSLFLTDVIPYAILDEKREAWRPKFYQICRELVKDCQTASEAAQVLNRDLFNQLNVHYHTGRKKPNQSPSESVASGKATCTGLSIILAYGCRAVGIPARLVGTPLWSDKSGNHTWVEVWDGEWKFLGADEYDEKGLNRAWFVERAAHAKAEHWQHAIWATSWAKGDGHFPMVWDLKNHSIGAKNVTSRYAQKDVARGEQKNTRLPVRVFKGKGGPRVVAQVSLLDAEGESKSTILTKAGTHDLNDVTSLLLEGEGPWKLRVESEGNAKMLFLEERPEGIFDVVLQEEPQADPDVEKLREQWENEDREEREKELAAKVIRVAGKEMRYLEKRFGEAPEEGHSLWISLHGGGGAPPQVNDQQWKNQIRLYRPAEGYYVAPRAPTDTWNLWHQKHIDALLDRLLANYVACRGVDPNRVYLLGYSAGGDGVYQLAPRMADRFAAAAMMAGHPNETKPDGLRNLPFEIFMGSEDGAYDRNKIAAKWGDWLAEKKNEDPDGYPHRVTIYPGLGHWMDGRDAEALPRMSVKKRVEWPSKIVWLQDDVTHRRFYWLGIQEPKAGQRLVAEVIGQKISVQGKEVRGLQFWLSDELLDLDKEIVVEVNDEEVFRGQVQRSTEVAAVSLRQRCGMVATALLEL